MKSNICAALAALCLSAGFAQAAPIDVTAPPFDAACDGLIDDTAAIQAAVTETEGLPGAAVYIPRWCVITQAIYVTDAITISCADPATSGLLLATPGVAGGIDVHSDHRITLQGCGIAVAGGVSQGPGSCISLAGSTSPVGDSSPPGVNDGSVILNNALADCYIGIELVSAARFHIAFNHIAQFFYAGVRSRNVVNSDSGDGDITGNQILGLPDAAIADVLFITGSGLRIENNKLQKGQFGVYAQLPAGVVLNDFFVIGNSIEGHSIDSIRFSSGGSTVLQNVIVDDNELHPNPGLVAIRVTANPADTAWINGLNLIGNSIMLTSGALRGIDLYGVKGLALGTNFIRAWGPAGLEGIRIRGSSSLGTVEHQVCEALGSCIINGGVGIAVE